MSEAVTRAARTVTAAIARTVTEALVPSARTTPSRTPRGRPRRSEPTGRVLVADLQACGVVQRR
ncbi:hypothetical protein [Streptomyces sp. 142MFCol3.1]|uniref:hypothetical protein n=1 Tax=Streptomyces sp. 142MFCol3.1 TaxID=1172179 RepID=UPI00131A035C|nr:hypothetical protein [Streptomyces sp. 142MFCol3.1]